MKQELDLGHKHQPLILCSLERSILHGTVPSYPSTQSEKGNPVVFNPAPQKNSREDSGCPDGGLQAWLVVLGVRLPV